MKPVSHFIAANGIKHHYLEWGRPENPPLLLLHATGLCARPWQPIAQELAEDYWVMAFDQRGHGDTEPSDRGYSFALAGQDLAAIIQEMGFARLRAVGHSSGGLAILIAASLLPGRIGRAVLVETRVGESPANAPPGELQARARSARQKRAIWESKAAMYAGYRNRAAFKDWTETAFQAFIEGGVRCLPDGRAELKCPPAVEAVFYEQRDALSVSRYLQGLTGDFLLLLGHYPGAQTWQDAGVRRFQELVAGAQVKPMGLGSHFLPMEHPAAVLAEIRAFFSDASDNKESERDGG